MDFGFSGELIFLALLGLILFGPRKLPEIARKAGRFADDLKRAKDQFQDQLKLEVEGLDTATKADQKPGKSLLTSLYDDLKSLRAAEEPAKPMPAVVAPVPPPLNPASLSENANRIKELLANEEAKTGLHDHDHSHSPQSTDSAGAGPKSSWPTPEKTLADVDAAPLTSAPASAQAARSQQA